MRSLVGAHPTAFSSLPYVLISWIDSGRPSQQMPMVAAWVQRSPNSVVRAEPFVVTGAALVALNDEGLFAGFDELWVVDAPPSEGPPDSANILAPTRLDAGVPADVLSWMDGAGCRAGFGDGDGLNFVVRDRELAEQLGLS